MFGFFVVDGVFIMFLNIINFVIWVKEMSFIYYVDLGFIELVKNFEKVFMYIYKNY